MSERVKEIVPDLIEAIRNVLRKHKVTFDEYRAGFGYMIEVQEAKEIPLLLDALLNSTIVEIENETRGGTRADIQGPYYLDENYPSVTDALAVRPEDADAEDMIVRGRITDLTGQPVLGATIDIWHSTPDGLYQAFMTTSIENTIAAAWSPILTGAIRSRPKPLSPIRSRIRGRPAHCWKSIWSPLLASGSHPLLGAMQRPARSHQPGLFRRRRLCGGRLLRD